MYNTQLLEEFKVLVSNSFFRESKSRYLLSTDGKYWKHFFSTWVITINDVLGWGNEGKYLTREGHSLPVDMKWDPKNRHRASVWQKRGLHQKAEGDNILSGRQFNVKIQVLSQIYWHPVKGHWPFAFKEMEEMTFEDQIFSLTSIVYWPFPQFYAWARLVSLD